MRIWTMADLMGRNAECRACGKAFVTEFIKGNSTVRCRECLKPKKRLPVCRWCNKRFKARGAEIRLFCSRACSGKSQTAIAAAKREANPPPPKSAPAQRPEPTECRVYFSQCENCATWLSSGHRAIRFCDIVCTKAAAKSALIAKRTAARECKGCGQVFSPVYGEKRRTICSDACLKAYGRRAYRKVRRVRIGAACERVDPLVVFKRDGWRCRTCGKDTPECLRGTFEPAAPEMDHVLPLSRGGAHSYKNTQCLCRQCNQDKSDKHPSQFVCRALDAESVSATTGPG